MANPANCDRCNVTLKHGEGFALYSNAAFFGFSEESGSQTAPKRVGVMILCQACTDQVLNFKTFARPFQPGILPDDDTEADQMVMQAIDDGIADRCRNKGLTPAEAKDDARRLMKLFWADRESGTRLIDLFWST